MKVKVLQRDNRMTWKTFFKSSACKYGGLFGGLGFAAGAGSSAIISLKIASFCSTAVTSFLNEVGQNITISELKGIAHLGKFNLTIALDDLTANLPADWMEIINETRNIPSYCFIVPFTLGLCISAATAIGLASAVAVALHVRDEKTKANLPQELEGVDDRVQDEPLLVI